MSLDRYCLVFLGVEALILLGCDYDSLDMKALQILDLAIVHDMVYLGLDCKSPDTNAFHILDIAIVQGMELLDLDCNSTDIGAFDFQTVEDQSFHYSVG